MQEIFKAIIQKTIHPYLKREGFKKTGTTFQRKSNDLVHLINFQKSQGNSFDNVRFYINCGIYSPVFDETIDRVPNANPKESDCQFRKRFEDITGYDGQWFELTPETDADCLSGTILAELEKVLAFFDSIENFEHFLAVVNPDSYALLRYLLVTGRKTQALELLRKQETLFENEERWDRIRAKFRNICEQYDFEWKPI